MQESTRVELPLTKKSKLFSTCKTIGDVRKAYPSLGFVKYIYNDPTDNNKLKGAQPSDEILLVDKASITIVGDMNYIIQFSEDATSE